MIERVFLLLSLCVVMTVTSFLAGALPLSMSLSSSQLRTTSSLGMGVLIGTSLIVIIPEGIETIYSVGFAKGDSDLKRNSLNILQFESQWIKSDAVEKKVTNLLGCEQKNLDETVAVTLPLRCEGEDISREPQYSTQSDPDNIKEVEKLYHKHESFDHKPPTFYIGLSLLSGFVLMFLIDKLSRLAFERLTLSPPARHISLSNLSVISSGETTHESQSFLHSLTPTPKQSRSLTTTIGIVIHAIADGVAIGASISTSNTRLGFIIFIAIMLHKAPAAFGLTSILLKQGLSKRAARGHLIMFSLATPTGATMTWLLILILGGSHTQGENGRWWAGIFLLLSAGTFLYVSMHAVHEENTSNYCHSPSNAVLEVGISSLPRKGSKFQIKDTLAAICGMVIPLVTQLNFHH